VQSANDLIQTTEQAGNNIHTKKQNQTNNIYRNTKIHPIEGKPDLQSATKLVETLRPKESFWRFTDFKGGK